MDIDQLTAIQDRETAARAALSHEIRVCVSSGCRSSRSLDLKSALEDAVERHGLGERCRVKGVGCIGLCGAGPLVAIDDEHVSYQQTTDADAGAIVAALNGAERPAHITIPETMPFFDRQVLILRDHAATTDPERIEDAIAAGGYQALHHVLTTMTPEEVIREITDSGLRGRGGAGYPAGLKWQTVRKMPATTRYVVCNGDEGDPGAFMDRSLMEDTPHAILEGMAIAGYAVGANQGYIYVRAEYPLAIERLKTAIKHARRYDLLGKHIFGTDFDFSIDIRLGAGAFVCGEETALIRSIEGKRGTARPRPPYPAESGLWEQATLINNVETIANIPPIIRKGSAWFAGIGTEHSKGTKLFALSGKIANIGLIEVPMGISLRDIVFEIGGGIVDGGTFKAIQTGGPSGGCIPMALIDTPVDYESLKALGSIMGSGGMIVMDETSSMVEVARYFMEFCMSESCGNCVPCRVGTVQMFTLLSKIKEGQATRDDIAQLERLCDMVKHTSLCGLGQSAPNPVMSTLRYFREEYEALLQESEAFHVH
jgi:bidirectional [NiFe] hydrogenase diaphorase subunit